MEKIKDLYSDNFLSKYLRESYDYKFISEEKCKEIQEKLSNFIIQENKFDIKNIHYIAGVDLAYWKENNIEKAVCCICVIDFKTGNIIERQYTDGIISFPYISGYLAFRELPLIIKTANKINTKVDIYMFDGNGYLHKRNMGIASHASFYLKKPTIGVAKSYFKINNVDFDMPENKTGAYTDIIIDNKIYGRAVRVNKNVKPIFVSVGNYIDIDSCTNIVLKMTNLESRIPIPTRMADLDTHKMRKSLEHIQV